MSSPNATVGAVILFTGRLAEVVRFYRAAGVPLESEQHDEGPAHYACDLGETHFAVIESGVGAAPAYRSGGSCYVGLAVPSVRAAVEAARAAGATILQEPEPYPWGLRALVVDPDGRVLELFERAVAGGRA